ncbi:MAG TPA: VWA domain-containing protein [Candidatus Baltobacteraceae bacterium]|nr:VWA domain-containing protein [Candidatus Baltobacteraceae bacterium]
MPPATERPLEALAEFRDVLAENGIAVTPEQLARFGQALREIDLAARDVFFWTGFATLCTQREQLPGYARAFDGFWLGRARLTPPMERVRIAVSAVAPHAAARARGDERGEVVRWQRYSAVELERDKDFAAYTPEEFAQFMAAVGALRFFAPRRRTRRLRAARRGYIDLRRIVREASRTAGEPIRPRFRARAVRARRVVVLCDVSGSMEKHARALLAFFHAGVASGVPFEAFSLGTRATRLTRALRAGDARSALEAASRLAADWAGGTRLGETLKAFLDGWGARGIARRAIVVIVSDGWERGDVALLRAQMERLRRLAYRVIWVNPRKAADGYQPLAAGMAAALPYVDVFLSGHSLGALDELIATLFSAKKGEPARVPYRSDEPART